MSESSPVHPANPYAITKLAQNLFGELYAKAYDMHIMMVRAFNHIGPGQLPQFVVSDFCKQVAEISAGVREPVMRVGNLTAARDFTDVRDVVRAYSLLIEHGRSGEVYNEYWSVSENCDASLGVSFLPDGRLFVDIVCQTPRT